MQSLIQLSADALKNNLSQFKKFVGEGTKIILVVKANAYGHGMREIVNILENEADSFAVDDVHELHAIRFYTDKDVYVLGHVGENDLDALIDHGGIPVVYDVELLSKLNERARVVDAHVPVNIKIDALLGRQGVLGDEIKPLLEALQNCQNLSLRGIYAHFANIEDTQDLSHARKQIAVYKEAIQAAHDAGWDNFETHISSTAGICAFAEELKGFTHVRLGLGLYGEWPSEALKTRLSESLALAPCLRWVTTVAQVKVLPTNHPIGYGLTYVTDRPTKIAIVPQGYSDGYDRRLSNIGAVLIGGVRCPVLGRVAMNMFAVDVSSVENPRVGDEVVLIGTQGGESISAEKIATEIETISYEVLARLNPLIPREVV